MLPCVATAQSPSAARDVRVAFEEETLPNGLKVLYHVDRSTPVVGVNLWYNVGSKHEQPGRTGFAHLFEHMMFKGSRNVGDREYNALLEAAGGRAAIDINGTTWFDRTNYFAQIPSNQLELALWLEADRMGTLLETLTLEKLDNQREVVKNERRERIDNQPYGSWQGKMLTYVYPAGHPYHHDVIGSMEDLSAATLDDVRQFFRTYYAPNNAVLAIAGDIDITEAKAMVRKHFAAISRGPAPPPLRNMTLPARIGRTIREVVQDPNAPAPAVYIGFRVPAARDPRGPAVGILGSMLAGGRTSPMYKALVQEQQIATNVAFTTNGVVDGADILTFIAVGKPGASADSLEQALLAELAKANAAITQPTLDRIKTNTRFGFVNTLQRLGGFGGRADLLNQGWTYYRNANWVNTIVPRTEAVTVASVRALAAERLVPTNRVTLVYVPQRGQTPTRASR
jgi:zinc protease